MYEKKINKLLNSSIAQRNGLEVYKENDGYIVLKYQRRISPILTSKECYKVIKEFVKFYKYNKITLD